MAIPEHNNYDCVVVNGDSYSESGSDKAYGEFLAEYLDVPIKNFACRGSSNDRILRSTIEHIHSLNKKYKNPLVIIGWSFIRRMEVWYYGENRSVINCIPDRSQGIDSNGSGSQVGNVFYEQGVIVLTDTGSLVNAGARASGTGTIYDGHNLKYKSTAVWWSSKLR